jgi:ankyrin repeat protein
MELLLQHGASPDLEDESGWTPLARAVEDGNIAVLQLLLTREAKIDYIYNVVSESNRRFLLD